VLVGGVVEQDGECVVDIAGVSIAEWPYYPLFFFTDKEDAVKFKKWVDEVTIKWEPEIRYKPKFKIHKAELVIGEEDDEECTS
jgi:hypothetical protein